VTLRDLQLEVDGRVAQFDHLIIDRVLTIWVCESKHFGRASRLHGWRNALNYYGGGSTALYATGRVYEDYAFTSYARAMPGAGSRVGGWSTFERRCHADHRATVGRVADREPIRDAADTWFWPGIGPRSSSTAASGIGMMAADSLRPPTRTRSSGA
jgi:hypothetical protein